ncbi:MAG: FGGY family pentulose kinase [Devosia sp.]
MGELLVGVDVGTGSARAGVFSAAGAMLGRGEHAIAMRRPSARVAEHDSEDIWRVACAAVRAALTASGARATDVAAIGFDATCSLVIRDRRGAPLAVSTEAGANWDTMVWLDHRAMAEAAACTATADAVLGNFGGVMSPEMEIPKLMWLKAHNPASWSALGYAFDLVDFLTWRATGSLERSQSTLASKWSWGTGGKDGWPRNFLARVGLEDLTDRAALPEEARPPGQDLGPLLPEAAAALGLTPEARVAAGLIDAHAGALGVLGKRAGDAAPALCLMAGTSSSVLALSREPRPVRGVWGPYRGALLPGLGLLEAGQSATGALLDHVIRGHAAGGEPTPERHAAIAARVGELASGGADPAPDLHVLPDFHGNRSPLAEPAALGVISGLTLESDFDSLCRLYWRTAVALALGLRQNLEALEGQGFATDRLLLGGGHARNGLLLSLYAEVTGATIVVPNTDAPLLGAAMLAANAAGQHRDLIAAAAAMDQGGSDMRVDVAPQRRAARERDYRIFLEMQRQRRIIAGM